MRYLQLKQLTAATLVSRMALRMPVLCMSIRIKFCSTTKLERLTVPFPESLPRDRTNSVISSIAFESLDLQKSIKIKFQ